MLNLASKTAQPLEKRTRLQLPWALRRLLEHHRYKVLFGGRAATKSWSVARLLVTMAAQRKLRILCVRELQKSIKDSVHQLLCDQIENLGLTSAYKITDKEITCIETGSFFIFEGLHRNVSKIKGLEGIDIVWVEEAQRISQESWSYLIPTIRKSGSEIWVTFNPDLETDPTYQRFVIDTPDNCLLIKINANDNPWLSQESIDDRAHLYRVDRDAAIHIWEGETRTSSDAQVLHGKCMVEAFTPGKDWDGPYYGGDWGFSRDPCVLIKCWIFERRLYIEKESWAIKLELNDIAARWERDIPECVNHMKDAFNRPRGPRPVIRADNARPETISHLCKTSDLHVVSVDKWKGSVEDGIAFLRGFEDIVIDPRCKHFEQETRLYSYKEDRLTGDILTEIIDKHNHCIDSARYALAPVIKRVDYTKLEFL